MSRAFEIRREVELAAAPEVVWDAVATGEGAAGWLWPMEIAPSVGADRPTTVWDPPRRFVSREEGEDGWFNQVEFEIEGRPGDAAVLRYVHSGIIVEDWENQYDGAGKHTDFYLSTLSQYVRYFPGRHASYVSVEAPKSTVDDAALGTLCKALGLSDRPAVGEKVRVEVSGLPAIDVVVDYSNQYFLGLRDHVGLIRVFGRGPFGMPLSVNMHLFDDGLDTELIARSWQAYLDTLFS
jgi:hypothetical protein